MAGSYSLNEFVYTTSFRTRSLTEYSWLNLKLTNLSTRAPNYWPRRRDVVTDPVLSSMTLIGLHFDWEVFRTAMDSTCDRRTGCLSARNHEPSHSHTCHKYQLPINPWPSLYSSHRVDPISIYWPMSAARGFIKTNSLSTLFHWAIFSPKVPYICIRISLAIPMIVSQHLKSGRFCRCEPFVFMEACSAMVICYLSVSRISHISKKDTKIPQTMCLWQEWRLNFLHRL